MKFWEELSPKNRRYIVVGAAIGLFSLIMAIMPSGDDSERKKKEEPTVRAILTDDNDPDARFERLVAQIENMRAENKDLQREFERVQRDVKRQDEQGGKMMLITYQMNYGRNRPPSPLRSKTADALQGAAMTTSRRLPLAQCVSSRPARLKILIWLRAKVQKKGSLEKRAFICRRAQF
jgi:hypothetical protein